MTLTLGILFALATIYAVLRVSISRVRARRSRARGVYTVSPFDFERAERDRSFANHPAGQSHTPRAWIDGKL